MDTIIVYATKYGCTERCAEVLAGKLSGRVDLCNLKKGRLPELEQYDKVIIGGSIYIGGIQKEVKEFCSKNLSILKDKKIGLFICGMQKDDAIETELNTAFPQELLSAAVSREYFGGEFIFKKMNFLDRLIVKKVSKIDKDTSNIMDENINKLAQAMNL